MNTNSQIRALAELDGIVINEITPGGVVYYVQKGHMTRGLDYLNSRDSIIPLIEKCIIAGLIGNDFVRDTNILMTPSQLTEALLRATLKWK